jgi:poly(hydroxyalkanoate) depolymerase family esterase
MAGLRASLARLHKLRAGFERKLSAAAGGGELSRLGRPKSSRLREVIGFGSNPGDLRMFVYAPRQPRPDPALVVALHGCLQSASIYDHGSGWSELADRHGFVVIYPEQQAANNPKNCFSWFLPSDIARGSGEALSIRQMIDKAVLEFGIDRGRVFVTGLSAGGAMASVMLATYPEVFAGGAIIAGLPYGIASSVQEAFEAMFGDRAPSSRALGDRVRAASDHRGRWPTISVWHGSADTIVKPSNAAHIISQWLNVHGLPERPSAQEQIGDHTRRVWNDAAGQPRIESFTVSGIAHGVPLATSPDSCGAPGPFFLDAGLSSTQRIAQCWRLDRDQPSPRVSVAEVAANSRAAVLPRLNDETAASAEQEDTVRLGIEATVGAQPSLNPNDVIAAAFQAAGLPALTPAGSKQVDPGAIIAATLKAAGLTR